MVNRVVRGAGKVDKLQRRLLVSSCISRRSASVRAVQLKDSFSMCVVWECEDPARHCRFCLFVVEGRRIQVATWGRQAVCAVCSVSASGPLLAVWRSTNKHWPPTWPRFSRCQSPSPGRSSVAIDAGLPVVPDCLAAEAAAAAASELWLSHFKCDDGVERR